MSAFRWYGGKAHLVRHLVPLFPGHPNSHYIDVFGGGGAMILGKPRHTYELFNDLNNDITNYHWVLGDSQQREGLYERLQYWGAVLSRPTHARCRRILADEKSSPVDRAFAFLYVQFCSYAGVSNGGFCTDAVKRARGVKNLLPWAEHVRWRFQDILIECLDYRELLKRVQKTVSAENLFAYCDPPYLPLTRVSAKGYTHEMDVRDHEEMLGVLGSLQFPVMLSGYDHPIYRDHLAGWRLATIETRCWSSPSKPIVKEAVWMNYSERGELL